VASPSDSKLHALTFATLSAMSAQQRPVSYASVQNTGEFRELYRYVEAAGLLGKFGTAKTDSAGNAVPADASDLWNLYLAPAASQLLSGPFSAEAFDAVYPALEKSLFSEYATWNVWAPLAGFTSNVGFTTLANGVTIRELEDGERAYLEELAESLHAPSYLWHARNSTHALSRQIERPKAGPIPGVIEDPEFDLVITALRLVRQGGVWYAFTPVSRAGPQFGSWVPAGKPMTSWSDSRSVAHGPRYDLTSIDVEGLNQLVASLFQHAPPMAVGRALDRFNFSYERRRPEDRLVDCWVALEALFLRDVRDELSFRASLRLARCLGRTSGERQWLYRATKRSYKIRSGVVHGEPIPDGIWNVAEFTQEALRRALRQCVLESSPPDLEGLDLGAVRSAAEEG